MNKDLEFGKAVYCHPNHKEWTNRFTNWSILELTKNMFDKKSNLRIPVQNTSAITR